MKYFLALTALALAASAMPVEFVGEQYNEKGEFLDATHFITNGTTRTPRGMAGWATTGGGTRGGAGGAIWTVWDAAALRNALTGNERRVVYVRGRIDLSTLFTGSPGVRLGVGMYKSIIGGDRNAMIFGGGLQIRNSRQVIIQNIRFHNALSYANNERPNGNGFITNLGRDDYSEIDAVEVRNSHHVWIDHCEFADDPWNANNSPRRHDGLIDIVQGADLVSVSNSIFRNHNMVTLVGNDDAGTNDRNRLRTTFYLNWWQGTTQRNPRVRWGQVHILNNLFTDIRSYAVGAGAAARIVIERNYFQNTRRAWGFPAGTPNPMANVWNFNNWFNNSQFDGGIPSNVGWTPASSYGYTAMAASAVPAHVRRFSGIV